MGGVIAGESALATLLWGVLYVDDAGAISQASEQLRKMMGVIVVVCAAFGLTREGDAEDHRHVQRRGSGPGVQPNERVCIPRERQPQHRPVHPNERVCIPRERQPQHRPVHQGESMHTQRLVWLPEVHSRIVRLTARSPRAQNPDGC